MVDLAALASCVPPNVAMETVREIVRVESGGDPLALNVNGVGRVVAVTKEEAVYQIAYWIARGYSVDVGLMQINSNTSVRLGYRPADMLEPCTNLRSGSFILTGDYEQALQSAPPGQQALAMALSAYNTGSLTKGFSNGYVARFYGARGAGTASAPRRSEISAEEKAAREADIDVHADEETTSD